MLWGQDLNDKGPGARPYTDFVDGKKSNADRRREYLKVVTALLIEDLQSVADQWKPGSPKNFRAQRSEEHTSELQSPCNLVCRLLLEKKTLCQRDVINASVHYTVV